MKKFFNKIVLFLKDLFTNLDAWIHEHVQPSIELVERLKTLIDSPVANLITALIPGDFDDKLKEMLSASLAKALTALHVTYDIANEPDLTSQIFKLLNYLKTLSNPMRNAVYKALASEMAKQSGGTDNIKGHAVDLLVQMQYSKLKEGKDAADLPTETLVDGNVQNEAQ